MDSEEPPQSRIHGTEGEWLDRGYDPHAGRDWGCFLKTATPPRYGFQLLKLPLNVVKTPAPPACPLLRVSSLRCGPLSRGLMPRAV